MSMDTGCTIHEYGNVYFSMRKASDREVELREALRAWLREAIRASGLTATEVARRAGLSSTTLTRPVREGAYHSTISTHTIDKVAEVTGYPPPEGFGRPRPRAARGFAEPDAVPYRAPERIGDAAGAGRDWWLIKSRALDLEGYLPDDRVLVDLRERPLPGDIVVAQVISERGEPETVFRKFEPPFLVTRSTLSDGGKPILVDYERVSVMGVVVASWRDRKAGPA
jgi:transcriptional regulator with XRE-family HTH domain